jgi:uncharacterized membrane protein
VILSPGKIAGAPERADPMNSETDGEDLAETVVLSPGGRPGNRSGLAAPAAPPDNRTNTHREPERANNRSSKNGENKADAAEDDDILTETVILRPQKHKGSRDE